MAVYTLASQNNRKTAKGTNTSSLPSVNTGDTYKSSVGALADDKSGQNNGGVLGGIGYVGEKLGLGLISSIEGLWDFTAGGIAKLFGADDWAEDQFASDWIDYNHADEWFDPSDGWRIAGDVASGIGTSLPSIALSFVPYVGPALSIAYSGLSAAGNATKEAYRETGELGLREFGYGALVGATEAVVEKVTMGIGTGTGRILKAASKSGGKGVKAISDVIAKFGSKTMVKQLTADFISEGVEEAISEIMSPLYARMTYDEDAEAATFGEIGYSFLVGGLSGLVMSGGSSAVNSGAYYKSGNKSVVNGSADRIVETAKALSEAEGDSTANEVTYEAVKHVKKVYGELAASLETTGGRIETVKQKMLVGELKSANVAAILSPMFEKDAMSIALNAESVAEAYTAMGVKDGNGNPITFTKEELRAGIDMDLLRSENKAERRQGRKQVLNALATNPKLASLAVTQATGHLLMDAQKFSEAAKSGAARVTDANLNMFKTQASHSEQLAFARDLGYTSLEEFYQASNEDVRARVEEYLFKNGSEIMKQRRIKISETTYGKENALQQNMMQSGVDNSSVEAQSGVSEVLQSEQESGIMYALPENKANIQEDGNEKREVGNSSPRGRNEKGYARTQLGTLQKDNEGNGSDSQRGKLDGRGDTASVLHTRDSDGKRINSTLARKLSGTKVVDQNGNPLSLWHSTNKEFKTFNDGDIGLHFGTLEQATKRAKDNELVKGTPYNVFVNAYLNIENPIYSSRDPGNWRANAAALSLWADGVISLEERTEIETLYRKEFNANRDTAGRYNSESSVRLREMLKSKGYDGVAYPNGIEGEGMSYIAFDDSQIVRVPKESVSNTAEKTAEKNSSENIAEDDGSRLEAVSISVWAKQNVESYGKLSAISKRAVDDTIRQARAFDFDDAEIRIVANFAAHSGLRVVYDAALAGAGDGKYNGSNTVYIDTKAPAERRYSRLLLHEGGHALIRQKGFRKLIAKATELVSPEKAKEIRDKYTEYYEAKEMPKSEYEPIIEEEIAMAAIEDVLGVDGAWDYILAEEKTFGEKLLDFFRGAARDYAEVSELSKEARKLLNQYKKLFNEFSERNRGNNAFEDSARGGGRYALRDVKVPTMEEIIKKPPVKVVDISKQQTTGTFAERRRTILDNADEIISKPYFNQDTNTWIFITKKTYTHTFNNLGDIQLNSAEHIPEFIENAILTHSEKATHGDSHADGVYTLFAAAKYDHIYPVKLKVKEYIYSGQDLPKNIKEYFGNNPTDYISSYDTVVLQVEEIKESSPGSVKDMNQNDSFLDPEEPSTISIADLLSLVNGDAEKYLPKYSTTEKNDTGERLALPEKSDKVEVSRGKLAQIRANYQSEKKFIKKDILAALGDIDALSGISKKAREDIADRLWKGYNARVDQQGYDKYSAVMRDKLYDDIFAKFGKEMDDDALDDLKDQIDIALKRIVAEAQVSQKAKLLEQAAKESDVNYWKREYKELEGRDKLLGNLMAKAQKMKELKLGAFANATQHKSEIFKGSIESLSKINFRGNLNVTGTRRIIADLKEWYTKDNPVLGYIEDQSKGYYDEGVAEMLDILSAGEKGFTKQDLKMLLDVMSYFTNLVETYNKVWRQGKWQDAPDLAEGYIDILRKNEKVKIGAVWNRGIRQYIEMFGDPMSVARRMDMYEDGFFSSMLSDLRDAAVDAAVTEMEVKAAYDEFMSRKENKNYVERISREKVFYRDAEIPKMHLIGLYLTMKRKQAWEGIVYSGVEYRYADETIRIHGLVDPSEKRLKQKELENVITEQLGEMEKRFNAADKEYISILEKGYNVDVKKLKVDRDLQRLGFTNALEDYYYPIRRANIARNVDVDDVAREIDRVTNSSFNKDTVKGAKQKLFIEPADALFNRHVHAVCQYACLSPSIETFNTLFNLDVSGNRNDPISIRTESQNTWKDSQKYFSKLISDIQGIPVIATEGSATFAAIRGAYAKYQLGANPKVWLTQISSIFASSSFLDADSIARGFATEAKDIDEYCGLAKLRNYDNTAAMAQGNLESRTRRVRKKIDKFTDMLMAPIGKVDRFVVSRLFGACQAQIEKDGGAKIGTEENKTEAGKLLKKVLLETQQNSLATERSRAMRSGSEFMRTITMFTSDSMKVFGRVVDSVGEVTILQKKIKAESDEKIRAELKKRLKIASKNARKSIGALVSTAAFMMGIAQLFRWLYDKEQDEDESIAETMATDFVGNLFGGLPLIKDIYSFMVDGFELENYTYSSINDLLSSVKSVVEASGAIISGEASSQDIALSTRKLMYAVGQFTGVPIRNVYNVFYGLTKRFSPTTAYKIDNVFYDKNYKTDLYKAIENEDGEMAAMLLSLLYGETMGGEMSSAVHGELLSLSMKGYKVMPRAVPKSFTYNGEEFELDIDSQIAIRSSYSTSQTALEKLFSNNIYKGLDDEGKVAAIDYVYDLYYDSAFEYVTGIDRGNGVLMGKVIAPEQLALLHVSTKGLESDKDKNGKTVTGSKRAKVIAAIKALGISTEEKLLLICAKGYAIKDGDIRGLSAEAAKKRLLRYILSLSSLTKDEKAALAELCGFEVKNGRIVKNSVA